MNSLSRQVIFLHEFDELVDLVRLEGLKEDFITVGKLYFSIIEI